MRNLLTIGMAIFITSMAHAKVSDKITIGGNLWTKFTLEVTENQEDSGFDVMRGFIKTKYQFDKQWSAIVNVDARTSAPKVHLIHEPRDCRASSPQPDCAPNAILFFGFLEGKGLLTDDVFRFGVQPNFYLIPLHQKMKSRWLSMTLAHEAGFLASMQAGVGYSAKFADMVTVAINIHDGRKGYGKTLDQRGAVSGTVTVASEKLGVSLNVEQSTAKKIEVDGTMVKNPTTTVANGALFFVYEKGALSAEFAHRVKKDTKDAEGNDVDPETGYGVNVNTNIYGKIGYYGRYFTGNDEFKNALGAESILTTGPTVKVVDGIQFAAIYENRKALNNGNDVITYSIVSAADF